MPHLHRRQFLTHSFKLMSAIAVGGVWLKPTMAQGRTFRDDLRFASPLSEVQGAFDSHHLTGDSFKKPHDLLRRLDGYIGSRGGWPAQVTESFDVIIVGGGLSGLLSAREMREKNWVVFEQADRFGGNSKSERHEGRRFGLGPAYIGLPDKGSPEDVLLAELNLYSEARVESQGESRVLFEGLKNFWGHDVHSAARECLARIEVSLKYCVDHAFPEIPWVPESDLTWQETAELDRWTALQWLEAQGPLHALVREYFQLYCWSAFGGSVDEISAAQFLNFVASESRGLLVFPGGNGRLAEVLYQSLAAQNPDGLRAGTLVLDVIQTPNYVDVLIERADGTLNRVRANSVIMAAPKYVARHLLRKNLEAEQSKAWEAINYRAYLVANVLVTVNEGRVAPAFDVFCLKGVAPETPTFGKRTDRDCTDFVMADWSTGANTSQKVITVYRPYPLDGARHFLMGFDVEKRKREISGELALWLNQLGWASAKIEGVRLSLWGHSVPLAAAGLMASGVLDKIAQPIGARIFFANQDDAANPAFETCFASARRAALQARAAF